MAYTTAQLVTLFTNANLGKAPDAATTLTLDAYATQSQTGGISDAVALGNTLKLLNSTTAVAISTYQFFTNRAPSAAGLDYLVDSTTNTNDLNDAYYAKFAQENRFINFAINLGTVGEGKTAFTTSYATVTYDQTIATAYDKIIGNTVAAAAGVNVPAALAYFGRAENITYLTAFVKANTSFTADADVTLAVKAALVGQILSAATSAGLGGYAAASTAMLTDLSDGTLATDNVAGVNILTAYPATGAVGTVQNLTTGIDTIVGTANNDTFNGTATAVANSSTVNLLDSIDGGLGADTLNISNAGAAIDVNLASLTVKGVETLNFTSVTGLNGGAVDVSGYTGLTQANISLAAPAAAQAVTAATSTGVALTVAGVGANNISTQGGGAVAVTATGQTTATINLGATTASTGVTSVTNTGVYADGANVTFGAITVKGGSEVSVTQATGITAAQATAAAADATNFVLTQAAVTVTGTAATKSVSISQAAAVTKVDSTGTDGKIGVAAGAVTITDVNNALTTANTITSVSLTNGTSTTINSSAVNSLTLNGSTGVVLTANLANVALSKTLTLNLAGGTSGVTDTNNEITSLTVNATAASTFSFADTGLTTLAVSGARVATLTNAAALTGLKTVTVTGAGGLTSTAQTFNANSVTKVDTTGSTGTTTVAIDGSGTAKTAFAGGAGIDIVTLVNALPAAGSVQLGAGNDRLLGTTAVAVSTTTVLDGGDGVDAVAATLINAGNASQFKGFEVLNLNSGGNFDVALLTGSTIQTLELNAGPGGGTYGGLTTAQSTTVTGTSTGTVTLAFAAATGTADAYTIGFNAIAATTSTATARTAVNAGTVAVGGIEAVTLNSGAASGFTTNTIALTDAEARTLTVTGAQDLVLSFTTAFGTANATTGFSSLDASAATGAVSVNTANIGSLTAGFAVKTGTGADTVTVAATQFATITTGAGKDTVVATASLGVQGAGATAAVYTTVADLASGDKITFVDTGAEVFTSTKVNVDAAANLGAALDLASAGAGNANGIISWFQYGGNTYIVNDNGAGATFANGTDIVVKLTGLIDLSTATGNGTNSITLA